MSALHGGLEAFRGGRVDQTLIDHAPRLSRRGDLLWCYCISASPWVCAMSKTCWRRDGLRPVAPDQPQIPPHLPRPRLRRLERREPRRL